MSREEHPACRGVQSSWGGGGGGGGGGGVNSPFPPPPPPFNFLFDSLEWAPFSLDLNLFFR